MSDFVFFTADQMNAIRFAKLLNVGNPFKGIWLSSDGLVGRDRGKLIWALTRIKEGIA